MLEQSFQLHALSRTTGAYVFVVVLGLLWGSFANVCIYRWPPSDEFPNGRSVVAPGSHCFVCKTPIKWYDNMPLIAFLWLRGRCRACKTKFSARYLIVEALTGVLFGVAWWMALTTSSIAYGEPFSLTLIRFAIMAAFCFDLVVIAFIDLDHKLILNKVTLPSIVLFYAATFLLPERRWYDGLIGAAIGYGVPWLIGELYFRVTKREGLGLGDSTFLAMVGALLGWKGVVFSLFGGSVIGTLVGIPALLLQRQAAAQDADAPAAGADDAPAAGQKGTERTERASPAAEPRDDAGEHAEKLGGSGGDEDPRGGAADERREPAGERGLSAEDEDHQLPDSLMKAELPFGPFLAMAALFYLFAEPWITLYFRQLL